MPKDNEKVLIPTPGVAGEPLPAPFPPEQMVRCEECLRANPPTRVNCLYCGAALPVTEATNNLQRPSLRPLEKWEQGYNNILLPSPANARGLSEQVLQDAGELLRLSPADLRRILATVLPLPVARTATRDEAELIERRLEGLGIKTAIFVETNPGAEATGPIKIRAIAVDEPALFAFQTPDAPAIRIRWADIELFVSGRLVAKRVELQEQAAAHDENRILAASEFVTDETVLDIYAGKQPGPYRIAASSFDFSCLGANKGLLASQNFTRLIELLRLYATGAAYDETFDSARRALALVWPAEPESAAGGWRRERPGKYSMGTVTEQSNEMQFRRYSQLRYHLLREQQTITHDHT